MAELPAACHTLGIAAPLLVTDPGVAQLQQLQRAQQSCLDAGLALQVFSAVRGNPTGGNVDEGVRAFRAGGHDGVIAIGGGSALDVGKTIALMAGQARPLWDFEDAGDNWLRVREEGIAPIVAAPTTAGTGSEVGRASVITDETAQVKKIIFHPRMLPQRVILDPELTVALPPELTAATGMDALSHSLEAYCANAFHPMADGIALEGMRLVQQYLPAAVASGDDLQARMQMLAASSMGATAFQKGLGAMHALAHSLGALYDAHHGLLNAILMPYVLEANRAAVKQRLARAAAYLGLQDRSCDGFIDWVLALRREVGIPAGLADIGITDGDAQRVGEMAASDAAAAGNPIAFDADAYRALFTDALTGRMR
ncbi:MAG: iron-containing alcohol dehydrogenase, partial [Halioglobus sp.]|nr:iron-containing alcohol dehydrogenase [Halioglobus sp.]